MVLFFGTATTVLPLSPPWHWGRQRGRRHLWQTAAALSTGSRAPLFLTVVQVRAGAGSVLFFGATSTVLPLSSLWHWGRQWGRRHLWQTAAALSTGYRVQLSLTVVQVRAGAGSVLFFGATTTVLPLLPPWRWGRQRGRRHLWQTAAAWSTGYRAPLFLTVVQVRVGAGSVLFFGATSTVLPLSSPLALGTPVGAAASMADSRSIEHGVSCPTLLDGRASSS